MLRTVPQNNKETITVSKVFFDVLDREKVLEILSARPNFIIVEKEESGLAKILWLLKTSVPLSSPGLFGVITLGPTRLILECITQTAAATGHELLSKIAGVNLRYRLTTFENPTLAPKNKGVLKDPLPDQLAHLPPEFFKSYFEVHWIHQKIPALGGLTPLQCARSRRKKGQDQLAALLANFKKSAIHLYDFDRLINILGLKDHPIFSEKNITRQKLKEKITAAIDGNLRFIGAIDKAGITPPALDRAAFERLAEVNILLRGLIYFLDQGKKTEPERSALANIVGQITKMAQLLQMESISSPAHRKIVEELISDPTWNHRQPVTAEMVETMAGEMEKAWRDKFDQKPIRRDVSLTAALNKMPAVWVTGIVENLDLRLERTKGKNIKAIFANLSGRQGLKKTVEKLALLSAPAVKVLKIIYTQGGGIYPYGKLVDLWGGEETDGYFWNKRKPISPIGLLRSHGLVFVGRLKDGSSYTKTAVIPTEIRSNLASLRHILS